MSTSKEVKRAQQDLNWAEGDEQHHEWARAIYKRYVEKKSRQNFLVRFADWLFGPFDPLAETLIDSYGEHNLNEK